MKVKFLTKQDPLKWKDSHGYSNIKKQSPRVGRQMAKIKVLLLGESVNSPKKASSTKKLGLRLKRILADAKKSGNTRKITAIRRIMRQRASFLRSMFRD